jgi:hypothetical protein
MRNCAKTVWLGCALLFFCLCSCLRLAAQDAAKVTCPDTVSLTDPQLSQPVAGWNVFFDTPPHRLTRVTFFEGPVEQHASLVPDQETRRGRTTTAKWLLHPQPERPYWLACYFSGTSLALSRALPAGLKQCTVTYLTSVEIDGMPEIKSLSCN